MSLEYEEEDDLFGDEGNINVATPLNAQTPSSTLASSDRPGPNDAGPSRQVYTYPITVSARKQAQDEMKIRMNELREKKRRSIVREARRVGPPSLRECCMSVVKSNSSRIWDIGDLEYPIIHSFLDDLPREHLEEIEHNSPHIKKDTDWLWELYIIEEYPLFHERCRERQGEPRTSGWRRMYKKAKEDAEERQVSAVNRVAERYRQLEEEKAAKRIVIMDKLVPDRKAKRGGYSNRGRGGSSGGSRAPAPVGALAKARADAQRARVAMTHASGKYVPPPNRPAKSPSGQNELFKNPYLAQQRSSTTSPSTASPTTRPAVTGPRIPPPRSKVSHIKQPIEVSRPSVNSSPQSDKIPGSYPTSEINNQRKSLPSHITPLLNQSEKSQEARFRLAEEQSRYRSVKKPEVANFEPPKLKKTGVIVDFFGDEGKAPKGFMESLNRTLPVDKSRDGTGRITGQKRSGGSDHGIFIKKKKVAPGK